MTLERILSKATAVATDAGLWTIGTIALAYYGLEHTTLLHSVGEFWKRDSVSNNTPVQALLLGLPAGLIIAKNVIEYNRIERYVEKNGFTPKLFHNKDGQRAELYARSVNRLNEWEQAKKLYEQETSKDYWSLD